MPAALFCHGLRQMARLGGTALVRIEEAFDDAIFERMEGDDGEPSAFNQQALAREQALDQLPEFVVHGDAERLEAAGRGVSVTRLATDGFFDQASQFGRRRDRLDRTCRDDRMRNAARFELFAIGEQQVGEIGFIEAVDEVRSGLALPRHAHVEGAIAHE